MCDNHSCSSMSMNHSNSLITSQTRFVYGTTCNRNTVTNTNACTSGATTTITPNNTTITTNAQYDSVLNPQLLSTTDGCGNTTTSLLLPNPCPTPDTTLSSVSLTEAVNAAGTFFIPFNSGIYLPSSGGTPTFEVPLTAAFEPDVPTPNAALLGFGSSTNITPFGPIDFNHPVISSRFGNLFSFPIPSASFKSLPEQRFVLHSFAASGYLTSASFPLTVNLTFNLYISDSIDSKYYLKKKLSVPISPFQTTGEKFERYTQSGTLNSNSVSIPANSHAIVVVQLSSGSGAITPASGTFRLSCSLGFKVKNG